MAGQVGWVSESTWGTGVTVTKFMPALNANLQIDEGYMLAKGIRAGRRTNNPALLGERKVSGSVQMELPNTTIAALFKHLFGAVATTGSGPYTHTFTPGPHLTKSLTLQYGIEDATQTVQPFTATGVKVDAWDLSCTVGQLAELTVNWTAKDAVTATGLASASYASGLAPFTFVQGSITVNGSAVASANTVKLSATKNLKSDRFVLGSRTIREQLEQQKFDFTSEITADFDSLTLFNLAVAATQVASVYTFSNGTDSLTITCNGQVVGDPPSLTGIGLEPQTIKLTHSDPSTDAGAITAVLIDAESTAA